MQRQRRVDVRDESPRSPRIRRTVQSSSGDCCIVGYMEGRRAKRCRKTDSPADLLLPYRAAAPNAMQDSLPEELYEFRLLEGTLVNTR